MSKNKKILIVLIAVVVSSFWGIFFFISYPAPPEIVKDPIGVPLVKTTLEINGIKYESQIQDKTSVYDFMKKLQEEGKINFKDKNYIGMGEFIEEINGIKNSGEKNWIYYVNGKKAPVGVSSYQINSGDVVSWKLEKNY